MLAIILLSAVVEAARGRYRSPSPAKQEQIVAREASQRAAIDTERAKAGELKAEFEKAQAAFMAAQARADHEEHQLKLLQQYTVELIELQKASEKNAEQIDAVVQKIQALNLAGLQEATHEVKVAQAETVQAAEAAGQPIPPGVAEAAVQADQAFVEAAHTATAGTTPPAEVIAPPAIDVSPTVPAAEPAPTEVVEQSAPVATPEAAQAFEPAPNNAVAEEKMAAPTPVVENTAPVESTPIETMLPTTIAENTAPVAPPATL